MSVGIKYFQPDMVLRVSSTLGSLDGVGLQYSEMLANSVTSLLSVGSEECGLFTRNDGLVFSTVTPMS